MLEGRFKLPPIPMKALEMYWPGWFAIGIGYGLFLNPILPKGQFGPTLRFFFQIIIFRLKIEPLDFMLFSNSIWVSF